MTSIAVLAWVLTPVFAGLLHGTWPVQTCQAVDGRVRLDAAGRRLGGYPT